jgi:hypothetical protein
MLRSHYESCGHPLIAGQIFEDFGHRLEESAGRIGNTTIQAELFQIAVASFAEAAPGQPFCSSLVGIGRPVIAIP